MDEIDPISHKSDDESHTNDSSRIARQRAVSSTAATAAVVVTEDLYYNSTTTTVTTATAAAGSNANNNNNNPNSNGIECMQTCSMQSPHSSETGSAATIIPKLECDIGEAGKRFKRQNQSLRHQQHQQHQHQQHNHNVQQQQRQQLQNSRQLHVQAAAAAAAAAAAQQMQHTQQSGLHQQQQQQHHQQQQHPHQQQQQQQPAQHDNQFMPNFGHHSLMGGQLPVLGGGHGPSPNATGVGTTSAVNQSTRTPYSPILLNRFRSKYYLSLHCKITFELKFILLIVEKISYVLINN